MYSRLIRCRRPRSNTLSFKIPVGTLWGSTSASSDLVLFIFVLAHFGALAYRPVFFLFLEGHHFNPNAPKTSCNLQANHDSNTLPLLSFPPAEHTHHVIIFGFSRDRLLDNHGRPVFSLRPTPVFILGVSVTLFHGLQRDLSIDKNKTPPFPRAFVI